MLYTTAAFAEKNPNTAQALVTALVRGLKWVQSHTPEEIAKVMPEEYALGNKEIYIQSIKTNLPAYSPDGKFIPRRRRDRLKVLKAFDPNVQDATIDLSKTYTDKFVDQGECGAVGASGPSASRCGCAARRAASQFVIAKYPGPRSSRRTSRAAGVRTIDDRYQTNTSPIRLCVMHGDGIGPEITAATLHVLRAAAAKWQIEFAFDEVEVGLKPLAAQGTTFPEASFAAAQGRRRRDPRAGVAQRLSAGRRRAASIRPARCASGSTCSPISARRGRARTFRHAAASRSIS